MLTTSRTSKATFVPLEKELAVTSRNASRPKLSWTNCQKKARNVSGLLYLQRNYCTHHTFSLVFPSSPCLSRSNRRAVSGTIGAFLSCRSTSSPHRSSSDGAATAAPTTSAGTRKSAVSFDGVRLRRDPYLSAHVAEIYGQRRYRHEWCRHLCHQTRHGSLR